MKDVIITVIAWILWGSIFIGLLGFLVMMFRVTWKIAKGEFACLDPTRPWLGIVETKRPAKSKDDGGNDS